MASRRRAHGRNFLSDCNTTRATMALYTDLESAARWVVAGAQTCHGSGRPRSMQFVAQQQYNSPDKEVHGGCARKQHVTSRKKPYYPHYCHLSSSHQRTFTVGTSSI
jgi:hypothetical protein